MCVLGDDVSRSGLISKRCASVVGAIFGETMALTVYTMAMFYNVFTYSNTAGSCRVPRVSSVALSVPSNVDTIAESDGDASGCFSIFNLSCSAAVGAFRGKGVCLRNVSGVSSIVLAIAVAGGRDDRGMNGCTRLSSDRLSGVHGGFLGSSRCQDYAPSRGRGFI